MLTTYHDDRTDTVIKWNGSATFNVKVDGVDVDCFTVYAAAEPADPCTPSEAYDAALAQLRTRWRWKRHDYTQKHLTLRNGHTVATVTTGWRLHELLYQ